ncbi:hypothetical protein [uncultured Paludibaculum sp.]|uniref:hypothetical protein n=1 Tax=uncultured Paludibaculum sp. TaxID=1765020 RepID=UPI002AABEDD2|nr:hypothetical protein [uncultured Paludibaculum sp.]
MNKLMMAAIFVGMSVASAHGGPKKYSVKVPEKVEVGSIALQPGDYRVAVEGTTAVFFDDHSREIAKAPVTVSTADRKFEHTEIMYTKGADKAERMTGVDIGGTKLKLQFRN